jgi:ketosteroid isomerase-like protein
MSIATARSAPSDHDTLLALNAEYINSVQTGDVQRFDEILDADFYCSNPDGALIDRSAFLRQTAEPVAIRGLTAEDVLIQIIGDAAIIHARTRYTVDGREGAGRYTDVWARRGGQWRAVSTHVTRLSEAPVAPQ